MRRKLTKLQEIKMARPKNFDEDIVIKKAMALFWRHGYYTTSLTNLEKATELSRVSIYNTFGDKEGLFLRALDVYYNNAKTVFKNIAAGGLEEIAQFFEWFSKPFASNATTQSGCLMVNTVLAIGHEETAIHEKVKIYRTMLINTYKSALTNARESGDMEATDEEIITRAELLVGVQWGASSVVRFYHSTEAAAPMCSAICQTIRMWKNSK